MDCNHRWAVILAGGDGVRLLPLVRRICGDERPKQFCRVLGSETLLSQTRRRAARIVRPDGILVVLTAAHEPFYREELDGLRSSSVLIQPWNRGTAPAILWALAYLKQLDPNGLVTFLPSDHYIANESVLCSHLDGAFLEAARNPATVMLLGAAPDAPEVEYGWIEPGPPLSGALTQCFHVRRFWEKPLRTLASALMELGCLWNTFIMVGRVKAFLRLFQRAAPAHFRSLYPTMSRQATLDPVSWSDFYAGIPSTNFSQAVLAAMPGALGVIRADGLGWSDLGDPARVLSIALRKGIQREWRLDQDTERSLVAGALGS